ncbi:hypothetical protein F4680DRAFT_399989 [Xylaria scruposa]|nr:hypothetical protein F4680DRAFT_399989 [Xylaria scruposa]
MNLEILLFTAQVISALPAPSHSFAKKCHVIKPTLSQASQLMPGRLFRYSYNTQRHIRSQRLLDRAFPISIRILEPKLTRSLSPLVAYAVWHTRYP